MIVIGIPFIAMGRIFLDPILGLIGAVLVTPVFISVVVCALIGLWRGF